jgi:hypothetical protein
LAGAESARAAHSCSQEITSGAERKTAARPEEQNQERKELALRKPELGLKTAETIQAAENKT